MAKNKQDTLGSVETTQDEPKVIPGLWIAKGGGYAVLVAADSRDLAVKLVVAYTGLGESQFVLAQSKQPPGIGERVLRGSETTATADQDGISVTKTQINYELS